MTVPEITPPSHCAVLGQCYVRMCIKRPGTSAVMVMNMVILGLLCSIHTAFNIPVFLIVTVTAVLTLRFGIWMRGDLLSSGYRSGLWRKSVSCCPLLPICFGCCFDKKISPASRPRASSLDAPFPVTRLRNRSLSVDAEDSVLDTDASDTNRPLGSSKFQEVEASAVVGALCITAFPAFLLSCIVHIFVITILLWMISWSGSSPLASLLPSLTVTTNIERNILIALTTRLGLDAPLSPFTTSCYLQFFHNLFPTMIVGFSGIAIVILCEEIVKVFTIRLFCSRQRYGTTRVGFVTIAVAAGVGMASAETLGECSSWFGMTNNGPWIVSPSTFTPSTSLQYMPSPAFAALCAATKSATSFPLHVISAVMIGIAMAASDYFIDSNGREVDEGDSSLSTPVRGLSCRFSRMLCFPILFRIFATVSVFAVQLLFLRWQSSSLDGGATNEGSDECWQSDMNLPPISTLSILVCAGVVLVIQCLILIIFSRRMSHVYRQCISSVSLSIALAMTERDAEHIDATFQQRGAFDDDGQDGDFDDTDSYLSSQRVSSLAMGR